MIWKLNLSPSLSWVRTRRWKSQECTRFLGPNGIGAVQISPVTEHILGSETLVGVSFFLGKKIKPGSQADHFKKKNPQIWMTKNSLFKNSRLGFQTHLFLMVDLDSEGEGYQLKRWVRSFMI